MDLKGPGCPCVRGLGPLGTNSWSQASRAEGSGEEHGLRTALPREPLPSFRPLTPVSEACCEGRVLRSVDLSCFWSPFNLQMYMLYFILLFINVHTPLLSVRHL